MKSIRTIMREKDCTRDEAFEIYTLSEDEESEEEENE